MSDTPGPGVPPVPPPDPGDKRAGQTPGQRGIVLRPPAAGVEDRAVFTRELRAFPYDPRESANPAERPAPSGRSAPTYQSADEVIAQGKPNIGRPGGIYEGTSSPIGAYDAASAALQRRAHGRVGDTEARGHGLREQGRDHQPPTAGNATIRGEYDMDVDESPDVERDVKESPENEEKEER